MILKETEIIKEDFLSMLMNITKFPCLQIPNHLLMKDNSKIKLIRDSKIIKALVME